MLLFFFFGIERLNDIDTTQFKGIKQEKMTQNKTNNKGETLFLYFSFKNKKDSLR
jgi:hypothetical protein